MYTREVESTLSIIFLGVLCIVGWLLFMLDLDKQDKHTLHQEQRFFNLKPWLSELTTQTHQQTADARTTENLKNPKADYSVVVIVPDKIFRVVPNAEGDGVLDEAMIKLSQKYNIKQIEVWKRLGLHAEYVGSFVVIVEPKP